MATTLLSIKVDASAEGCSGMFYRWVAATRIATSVALAAFATAPARGELCVQQQRA